MAAGFLDFLWNGSPPPNVTNKTTSVAGIPDYLVEYTKGLLSKGNAIAAEPYQTYNGPRIAGFTQNQNQAFNNVAANQNNWKPAMDAATGYTNSAAGPFDNNEFQTYLSPYLSGVTDSIARLGQRNMSENLLPQVNDTFTGAGQFGSSGWHDNTARVLRDTNESILNQQAMALQQGYDSAMGNYQTAKNRQLNAGNQMGALGQMTQQAGLTDAAALEAAGTTQQNQNQKNLDLAYQDFLEQRDYPKTQAEWMSNLIRGVPYNTTTSNTTTGPGSNFQPSGLSQMAGIYSLLKGMKRGGAVRGYANGGPIRPMHSTGGPMKTPMHSMGGPTNRYASYPLRAGYR